MGMDGFKSGDLRSGQKFTTRLTKIRGIVEDVRRVLFRYDSDLKPVLISAPRVILVTPWGVVHKTLHPDVIVDLVAA